MTIEILTTFLGWCSVINIGIFVLTGIVMIVARPFMVRVHNTLLGVDTGNLPDIYFKYLAYYQIAILTFNVVPYFALKMMA